MRPTDRARATCTGNPVRPAVLAAGEPRYRPPSSRGPIELLILGGSQGARILSELVPPALAALPAPLRTALRVSHQARTEDLPAAARPMPKPASPPSSTASSSTCRGGWRARIW